MSQIVHRIDQQIVSGVVNRHHQWFQYYYELKAAVAALMDGEREYDISCNTFYELRRTGSPRGHALPMQRGVRKGLRCLRPNELLDSGYMGTEKENMKISGWVIFKLQGRHLAPRHVTAEMHSGDGH